MLSVSSESASLANRKLGSSPRRVKPSVQISRTGLSCVFNIKCYETDAIARPLAETFRARGLEVWYDEYTLRVGDSLRKSIDAGLAGCKFGVVILSPFFFNKHWPEQELNGLANREVHGKKVILPVWHNVGHDDVSAFSPTLADWVGVSTSRGLEHVVDELIKAMG